MEMNTTMIYISTEKYFLYSQYIRSINFILSCTGLLFNFLLIIILLLIGRRHCTTYFLLLLMTICDFLYCVIYISILLTIDQHINIINHQILCPLSFFLTPFTFTGSTLLLFICLLHLITNYERKYDTVLGQIGGRLSVVFVLAFVIIRSVLSSTSIELLVLDSSMPYIQYCTVDTNIPTIVATVQKINHIFAEVSDILVYIGWIIVFLIYVFRLICCKNFHLCNQTRPDSLSTIRPFSFASLLISQDHTNVSQEQTSGTVTIELTDMLNSSNEITIINKKRHNHVSLIIISISLISIIFYLPIMISKYSTIYFVYRDKELFPELQTFFLQALQHTAHLFCLTIRVLPYFIYDKRIHLFMRQMFGIKFMEIETKKTLSIRRRKQKYICHFQCHRRREILDLNDKNQVEQ